MSFRFTAIMLGVLVLLGGVVWYTEFREKKDPAAEAKPAEKPDLTIFRFDEQDTRRLEVVAGERTMTADRNEQGEWTLQPDGQLGDRLKLGGALSRLTNLNGSRKVVDAPTDLEQYGLVNPSLSVTATQADGTTFTLQTGSKAPGDVGTYARKANEPVVWLVTTSFVGDFERMANQPPVAPPTPAPLPSPEAAPTP